jgi:Nif-specific regulatory protein
MSATLVAISGPLRGKSFPLAAAEFTIGRDPASSLCLDDPAVSRAHCVIREEDGRWRITDLESRNGTVVNGGRIDSRTLKGGEEIRVGQSVFVLALEHDDGAAVSRPAENISTRTMILAPAESIYMRPERLARESTVEHRLAALLRFSAELARVSDAEGLESQLRELVPELLPCSAFTLRTLDTDAPADESEARAAAEGSVVLLDRHALVVPLRFRAETALLLRIEDHTGGFSEDHLQIGAAIAAIGSLTVEKIRNLERLEGENMRLRGEIDLAFDMVGESAGMRELFQMIRRVAPSESTVLILGESGTGKELVARAVHKHSTRAEAPFVAINCAALTETLLESELFGHEKGAFTGASAQKRGRIEMAEGGTLFLDEVGEMAPALQAKLLRVLQEREFERVGGTRTLRADVRVIAATNRDLQQAVRDSGFRHDLYYRLNVIAIRTPPLRERREDIVPLANHFAARFGARSGRVLAGISPGARAALLKYEWPGNVRELENAIERAVVLGCGDWIVPEDLPEDLAEAGGAESAASGYHERVREAKRRIIAGAIEETGSHAGAAKALGLNPTYLSRLIRNLDLRGG